MKKINHLATKFTLSFLLLCLLACKKEPAQNTDWSHYLGSPNSDHFSTLDQIHPANVSQLQVAWTYHSGGADTVKNRTQIQCNPLIINGVLYGTSPTLEVFALDAATGKEIWNFTSGEGGMLTVNRGLAWWESGQERRLLVAIGDFLYALDPADGKLIASFGKEGKINLHDGLGTENALKFVVVNTPGIVFKDLYIVGSRVDEDWGAAPGHIRAYNVRTGELDWIFRTIPMPGEGGYESWQDPEAWRTAGAANSWAGMSLDEKNGIVFIPTGSAAYDFWGGNRKGNNLFANCLIALDAASGKRLWHFQTVHHDLWDKDLPAPPNLLTVKHNGKNIEAVAQVTKTGYVFLFDRKTGQPLFPIEERPVPASDLPGELASKTQPRPTKPAPFIREIFTEKDVNPFSPDKEALLAKIRQTRTGEIFMPPSQKTTMIFPGFDGGAEWGGAATDPDGVLYVNANEMPWIQTMQATAEKGDLHPGQALYFRYCTNCHGWDRAGDSQGAFPSLLNLKERQTEATVGQLLLTGKTRMPAYQQLSDAERAAIVAFLFDKQAPDMEELKALTKPSVPFKADGYNRFLDSKKMPAIAPPWGTLSAIDLNTGEYRWKIPFGEHPAMAGSGTPSGSENYGGPVVTASGLIFIAATMDEKIRAFDKKDGKLLWEAKLPAAGYATPATYSVNGKQYVVIACGGGKCGTKSGDAWVAFALR